MKVICYGELMIDMIAKGRQSICEATDFCKHAGGAAANVATQISKLGGQAAFLGKLGDDAFGHYLMQYMRRHKVDTQGVVVDPARRTTVAFIGLDEQGIPSYLFYRAGGASETITPADMDESYIKQADIVYSSSLMLTAPQVRETTKWIFQICKAQGIVVAFDLNLRLSAYESAAKARETVKDIFPQLDILKINDTELDFLLDKESEPVEGGKSLLAQYPNLRVLIITCGAEGAYLLRQDGQPVFMAARQVKAIDTTGAGDSYMGAFLYAYGLFEGDLSRLECMAEWAAAVAELTVQGHGAIDAMPDFANVQAYCNQNHIQLRVK